ncbi:FAD/NAD(P)-binding domain-containing protein [Nemania sp. FL0031]|nr:FAD/NAD(P)-binding domain-containing protein [Nemania sp. FL0031]
MSQVDMEKSKSRQPIIIVGAGIVGLTLAQALKKEGIPFQLFERDKSLDHRSAGWGITIHWALKALESCLPADLFARVDEVQVDPEQGRQDNGRFLFLDLETLKPRFVIPPNPRKRIIRSKFRRLLTQGLDIHWGKSLSLFTPTINGDGDGDAANGSEGITVTFTDGTSAHGALLIAADGSNSKARSLLLGSAAAALHQLPVRLLGVTARFSAAEMAPLRAIDPLFFQGAHPATGNFMWFSVLSTPESNESGNSDSEQQYYEAQINLSWIVKGPEDNAPATNAERLARMKGMVGQGTGFHGVPRRAVEGLPGGTNVQEIKLADWPTMKWEGNGLVTLLGDAAHPMTMYRGEAANHGLLDASKLKEQLKLWYGGSKTKRQALEDFETEMRERTHEAVLLSRQACLDAHGIENLGPDSPLVSSRARVLVPGSKV